MVNWIFYIVSVKQYKDWSNLIVVKSDKNLTTDDLIVECNKRDRIYVKHYIHGC